MVGVGVSVCVCSSAAAPCDGRIWERPSRLRLGNRVLGGPWVARGGAVLTVELSCGRSSGGLRPGDVLSGVRAGAGRWGWARPRTLRGAAGRARLRPRRARCRGCLVTHVLLPVCALLRRADLAEVIGAALVAKAGGVGVRGDRGRAGAAGGHRPRLVPPVQQPGRAGPGVLPPHRPPPTVRGRDHRVRATVHQQPREEHPDLPGPAAEPAAPAADGVHLAAPARPRSPVSHPAGLRHQRRPRSPGQVRHA